MARNAKTNKRKAQQAAKVAEQPRATFTRRKALGWLGGGVVGAGVLGAGGVWAVNSYSQSQFEHDLTRIGNGKPAIVQIHDPQCPICNALQRETRKALAKVEGEPPIYLIADITQTGGAVFAQQHGVQHVTLIMFDGEGTRMETLTGSRTRKELAPIFEEHSRR